MSTMHELWVVGQEFQRAPSEGTLDGEENTRLLDALLRGDVTEVQRQLVAGAAVGLREAALLGDAVRTRRLLSAGADPFPDSGWSALHLAAWAGSTAVVEALLEDGVPVDLISSPNADPFGCTAIHLAAARGHRAVVEQLLRAGADASAHDSAGWTPLHQAAERGDLALVKTLLLAGVEVNPLCGETTPLGLALHRGHQEVVSLLRQCGGSD